MSTCTRASHTADPLLQLLTGRTSDPSALDWDQIMELGLKHEVLPLLHVRAQHASGLAIPQVIRQRLMVAYAANLRRIAAKEAELSRVLQQLATAGVRAMPFKGPVLAAELYGDSAARVSADLDLIVPREQVLTAGRQLQALGYRSPVDLDFIQRYLMNRDLNSEWERPREPVSEWLELHWGVMFGGSLDVAASARLWRDAQPCTVLGAPAWRCGREWQFLLLMAHASRHEWRGLKWLLDLWELQHRQPPLDWTRIYELSTSLGWQKPLALTVAAYSRVFGVSPATGGRPQVAWPSWARLYPETPYAANALADVLRPLRLLPSRRQQLRYLWQKAFVPAHIDARSAHLPCRLRPLYYLLRPARLAWQAPRQWLRPI